MPHQQDPLSHQQVAQMPAHRPSGSVSHGQEISTNFDQESNLTAPPAFGPPWSQHPECCAHAAGWRCEGLPARAHRALMDPADSAADVTSVAWQQPSSAGSIVQGSCCSPGGLHGRAADIGCSHPGRCRERGCTAGPQVPRRTIPRDCTSAAPLRRRREGAPAAPAAGTRSTGS